MRVLFAALFLICATLLLAAIGDQTKWLKGKAFFAQPRFWPGIGVGGMVLFTALHYWNLPRRERRMPRWIREADWFQWAESLFWAVLAGGLALTLGPVLAAPFVFLVATLRISYLYLHKMDWKEAKIWLSVFEWAGWFLAYVVLVPVLGYLPMTLVFRAASDLAHGLSLPPHALGVRGLRCAGGAGLQGLPAGENPGCDGLRIPAGCAFATSSS